MRLDAERNPRGLIPILSVSAVLRNDSEGSRHQFFIRYSTRSGSQDLYLERVDRDREIWVNSLYEFIQMVLQLPRYTCTYLQLLPVHTHTCSQTHDTFTSPYSRWRCPAYAHTSAVIMHTQKPNVIMHKQKRMSKYADIHTCRLEHTRVKTRLCR